MEHSQQQTNFLCTNLREYIERLKNCWSSSQREKDAAILMRKFILASPAESPWVKRIKSGEGKRAYTCFADQDFGFVQKVHFHPAYHKNSPHDHGKAWVVYGVYSGTVRITVYRLNDDCKLEIREVHTLGPGTAYPYYPGEIHSTEVLSSEGAIVLRFLSEDLSKMKRNRYSWEQVVLN